MDIHAQAHAQAFDRETPDAAEVLARVQALLPRLRERAEECERLKKAPPETIEDFHANGLFVIGKPKAYGGYELGYDVVCEAIMDVASACGSSAWNLAVLAEHNVTLANSARQTLDIIWGENPNALLSTGNDPKGVMKPVDGGYLFNAQINYSSGCDYVDWWMGGGSDPESGARVRCLVPRSEGRILEDSWEVMGLSGSGSKSVEFKDVFIPAERQLVGHGAGGERRKADVSDHPTYKLPPLTTTPYSLSSVCVGIAQGFINDFVGEMKERSSRFGAKIGEFQSLQLRIAESAAEHHAAKTVTLQNLRESMDMLSDSETLHPDIVQRNRRDMSFVSALAVRAVDRLFYAAGANGLFLSNDLQRKFRDVHAGAQQIFLNWDINMTAYGRQMLGLEPGLNRP